jgi:hypothetical protein
MRLGSGLTLARFGLMAFCVRDFTDALLSFFAMILV